MDFQLFCAGSDKFKLSSFRPSAPDVSTFRYFLLSYKLSSLRSSAMFRLSIELISAEADKLCHVYLLAQLIFLVSDWSVAFFSDWLIVFARKIESKFTLII